MLKTPPELQKEAQKILLRLLKITKLLSGLVLTLIFVVLLLLLVPLKTGGINTILFGNDENVNISIAPGQAPEEDTVVKGFDVQTGLIAAEGLQVVKQNCTVCHSANLILENRFSREGWEKVILWMQETQGLWELGQNQEIVLDYLERNYAPEEFQGRRRPLGKIEWYVLEN